MSKHRERSLDVVSGIDEELVDKATVTRIRYFKSGKKSKKLTPIIAIAASLALLLSVFLVLLIPNTSKQVPIYTGMSVSHADGQNTLYSSTLVPLSAIELLDNDNTEGNGGNHGGNNPNKKPVEDIVNESDLNPAPGKELYYAKPGETIRITIHFDNPDQFEILSFTLNGAKYGIQMFLEGSDMENLIVEYTIPESAEGMTECTIDAIKYIDGETIKDVKIGGDRTVKIGVHSEKQPTAKVENEVKTSTDISFDVTVSDELGFIGLSEGKLLAVLVDKQQIIDSTELTVGEKKTVSFTSLDPNKYYRCAVVGVYDSFDGKGVTAHTLYSTEMNIYNVTYGLDGGEADELPMQYTAEDGVTITAIPIKKDHIFLGWTYGDVTEPQTTVIISAKNHGDVTLKAHWKPWNMKSIVGDGSGDVIFEYTGRFQSFVSPYVNDMRVHLGVDISADFGDPVYAAADGVISAMWNDELIGYTIAIKHADGYETFYRCVNEELLSEDFKVGVEVKKGQLIATVGEPNRHEHGIYHIHFEATLNEEIIDPKEIFEVF